MPGSRSGPGASFEPRFFSYLKVVRLGRRGQFLGIFLWIDDPLCIKRAVAFKKQAADIQVEMQHRDITFIVELGEDS